METEDDRISVYATAKVEVLAITPFGVDNLIEIIAVERDRQNKIPTACTEWLHVNSDPLNSSARRIITPAVVLPSVGQFPQTESSADYFSDLLS